MNGQQFELFMKMISLQTEHIMQSVETLIQTKGLPAAKAAIQAQYNERRNRMDWSMETSQSYSLEDALIVPSLLLASFALDLNTAQVTIVEMPDGTFDFAGGFTIS